ncbi:hypothetical protein Bca101_082885 [Brassica carinata]
MKSKEVVNSSDLQVGSTYADVVGHVDVHTRNEVDDGETDLLDNETILMRVEEIEAVYASHRALHPKALGMSEVDGTACEVKNKVYTTEDAALGPDDEGEYDDDEDYDYDLWHYFVGRGCEWNNEKDEDGGVGGGGRAKKTNGGVHGQVVTKARSGSTHPSSTKGSGSAGNRHRTASNVFFATANSTSTFEDYIDEGRDYIVSSRNVHPNIDKESNKSGDKSSYQGPDTTNHSDPIEEEDPNVDSSSQRLVLVTPRKPFNKRNREVDDSDDFVWRQTHEIPVGEDEDDDFIGPVPQCVSSRHTRKEVGDSDDFVDQVPQCVSSRQPHEIPVREDEDEDFEEPVPQCVSSRHTRKDTANDESLMKSVRAVEIYGFEDVEPSFDNVPVNDYTVDDIDFTLADPDIYVGRIFSNKQEFKISLAVYALKEVFRFKFHKHAFNYVTATCIDKTCSFYVMAKQMGESPTYQVRKAVLKHVCTSDVRVQFKKHATSKVITALMRSKYERLQAGPRAAELPEMLRTEFLYTATYWKCWKAKELATVAAQGTEESSYKLLSKYFYVLEYANPGTITDIKTEKDEKGKTRFRYAFMALKACIDGWKHLRKVIVVDGIHMFGKYKGCLLTASGQDANFQVFPIAFAVADNETKESWSWFFEKLTQVVEDGFDLSIVSDRATQICYAKDLWYPLAHHGCCLVHLQRNVDARYKKMNQKQLVGRTAEVFKVSHFEKLYAEIKLTDKRCWDYLELIDRTHWTRSHFEGERYNLMNSNIAESLNKALVHAHDFPIMALFEFIRRMISRWFVSRQRLISKMSGEIPPAVDKRLLDNLHDARVYAVMPLSAFEFEVTLKTTGFGISVNLEKRYCSCLEFQKVGIPCRHAIAVALFRDLQHSEFVADAYLKKDME